MNDIVIAHGLVVTVDPERRVLEDGAVALRGQVIDRVGKSEELLPLYPGAQLIDAKGMMVLPGLIDGHCHPGQYLAKGIADDVDIMTWLYKRIYPYEAHLKGEDVYLCGLGHALEMVKTGTTCLNDAGGYFTDQLVRAFAEVGVRAVVSRSTRDLTDDKYPVPPSQRETAEEARDRGEEVVANFNGAAQGRIRAWFSLRYIFNFSDKLARYIRDLAAKYGVGIHSHAAAIYGENELVQKIWGLRTIERLERLGLLAPNLYLVHMGHVNDREVELLAEKGVKVAHCPSASMTGAYGNIAYGKFPEMMKRGIVVSLGTDGAASGRFLDMVRVMYLAATAHREIKIEPELIGSYKALEMATVDGAKALLWDDEIGTIEAGKKADLILVDTRGEEWHPRRDMINHLIYGASGNHVDTVIIDGKVVVKGRKVVTVDEEEVAAQVHQASDRVLKRAGITVTPRWPII